MWYNISVEREVNVMANKPEIPELKINDMTEVLSQLARVVPGYWGQIGSEYYDRDTMPKTVSQIFWIAKQNLEISQNLQEQYKALWEFVNDYFTNLDVQEEINNWMNQALQDGTLANIIKPFIPEPVTDWLNEHITNPSNPPIDTSLTVGGAAADAEVVGNKLQYALKSYGYKNVHADNISFVTRGINLYNGGELFIGRINGTTGEIRKTSVDYLTTNYIYIGDRGNKNYLLAQKNNALNRNAFGFYDENMNYISGEEATSTNAIPIPDNAVWCRVSYTSVTTPNQIMIAVSENQDAIPLELPTGLIDSDYIPRVYLSEQPNTSYGAEMNTALNDWTETGGAVFNESQWNMIDNSFISKSFAMEENVIYHIDLEINGAYTPNDTISKLDISLGDNAITIFGANDGTWTVDLQSNNTGATIVKIGGEQWHGNIESISIKPIIANPTPVFRLNNRNFNITANNDVVGGGQDKISSGIANIGIGANSQNEINTGLYNIGIGFNAQNQVTVGSSNNAIGSNAQRELTTGMYNNALGTSAQRYIKNGCWNVAIGNECQRDITSGCNNVGVGRRAQNDITTGEKNVNIGAQSGFTRDGASSVNITDEEGNTAIGYQAGIYKKGSNNGTSVGREASAGSNAIAIGYNVDADDNEIVIGNENNNSLTIMGKTIIFNEDGTISWN